MKKTEQYTLISSLLKDEKTTGAIKSMSYNAPNLYELLLIGAKVKSGMIEHEKLVIDFTVTGQQIEVYNHVSRVTFYTIYDEQLSYVANVLAIFADYAITEYLVDESNEDKAYFELIKIKGEIR